MSGFVSMHRVSRDAPWITYLPDNSVLDTWGTHTMGLQEGMDWALANAFNWRLDAGGASEARPPVNHGIVLCTVPVVIKPRAVGHVDFGACTLMLQPNDPNDWGMVIDTQDMSFIKGPQQTIYFGDSVAVCEYPQNDNGEDFIGSCNNEIEFGDIIIADPTTYFPISNKGIGYRFMPTNGDMVNLTRKIRVNGGQVGVQIETPGNWNAAFEQNVDMYFNCLNQGYASIIVGLSDTDRIRGNVFHFAAAAGQRGIVTHAKRDTYIGSIQGPTIGVEEGASAEENRYIIADNRSTVPFMDLSVAKSSRWL